jgi:hypothetical protein
LALLVEKFTLQKPANTAVPFDESISTLSFGGATPKAIILFSSANTTTGTNQRQSLGFASGPSQQRAIGWSSANNSTPNTNAARIDSDQHVFRQIAEGGAAHTSIQLKTLDANGFTYTYVDSTSGDYPIHGLALGGTDITDVYVGTVNTPATATTVNVTAPNFTPDIVLFMTAGGTVTGMNQFSGTGSRIAFGAASSNARRATISTASRDITAATVSDTGRRSHSAKAIQMLSVDETTNVSTVVLEADLSQKLSTGFQLSFSVVPTTQQPIFYMAIKGGQWDVGTISSPASTGTQSYTTQFQPKGLMLFSSLVGTNNVSATHSILSLGAGTSSSAQGVTTYHDEDGVLPTWAIRGSSTTSILKHIQPTDALGAFVVNREAALQSFGATNFTLNWTNTTESTAAQIHAIVMGDNAAAAPTTVTKTTIGKYDKRIAVKREVIGKYSSGGVITVGPIEHTYDILGPLRIECIGKYDKHALVKTTCIGKYHIANVTEECIAKYDKTDLFRTECVGRYDIAESPELNLRRYLKPYGIRIFIMSHDQRETYHMFDSFNIHESTIRVQKVTTNLAIDEAGRFSILVEDSGHGIDTSEVGEGNSVLIQAAKTPEDMDDGKHNVLFGYITTKTLHREDTGVLKYEFQGSGSAIRFNERLTNFSRSARRLDHKSPNADPSDPDMIAWKLFQDVLTDAGQMPNGGPTESQFTMDGVVNTTPRVDSFIATLENELTALSESMDLIANNSGATWGVNYNPRLNDLFLRYATLEPSEIIIKSGSDVENTGDDKFHTSYIIGDWAFTDNRDVSSGFANQIYARVGTKSVKANVIELSDIIDQFTPLAINEPPTDTENVLQENQFANFGPVIFIRSDLIGPFSDIWTNISNLSREFNLNRNTIVMKLGTGSDGPGPAIGQPDWVTPWNSLVSARVRIHGYIDTQNGNKTVSAVQEEIDRWVNTWGPYGIYFDNMGIDTSKMSYYENLAAYAKSLGIVRVIANARQRVPDPFYEGVPSIDVFIIAEANGFLPITDEPDGIDKGDPEELLYSGAISRRGVFAYGISPTIASDDDLAQYVSNLEFYDTASSFYIQDDINPQPWDTLSGRIRACMFGAEAAAIRILQNNGRIIPGVPVQQDLAMSFTAETQNLGDIAIILSKIGNPIAEAGEREGSVFLEIVSNRVVNKTETDPNTGVVTVTPVNMPNYTEPIAYGHIPFSRIQDQFPSVIFFHGIVKRSQDIAVGSMYWVVLYGRGQNEENTIRWHHANSTEDTDYFAARRVPAAFRRRDAEMRQQWQVFTNTTHPGFSLSYFKNTTHMLVAADSDSIEQFGLVEADIDLVGVDDDAVAIRTIQAIINYSAKPKREFSLTCTVPDDLILPRMLVRIYDDMTLSGQVAGSTAEGTEAEIVSADMEWDANSRPMGCYNVSIGAIGHVDFAYARWLAKYKRKEISVKFPHIIPKPQGPPPQNNAPIVYAQPRGGLFSTSVRVSFTTNKSGVTIYYTTNGTLPIIQGAGTPSSENDTKIYIVGTSATIPITDTTVLKFKGVDTEGKESTIYTETYTMKQGASPAGGNKIMFMPYWQGPTAAQINNVFWTYMNASLDYVTYHKRTTENYEVSYQNGALGTPSREQEAEFEGYDEMVANIETAKAAGFEIIGYNIEGDQRYPSADKKDVVGFCKKFSEYVRKKGLKVKFNPSPEYTERYGSRIVQYCDFYNIQCQYHQGDNDGFRSWVRDRVQSIRSNNVNALITITLSADLNEHKSVKGQTRLQTLQNRWTYAKTYVDGIRIFYQNATELNTIVSPFMNWFISSGRAV